MEIAPRPQTAADYPGAELGHGGDVGWQMLKTSGAAIGGVAMTTAIIAGGASMFMDLNALGKVGGGIFGSVAVIGGLTGGLLAAKYVNDRTHGPIRTVTTSDAAGSAELLRARPDIAQGMVNVRPLTELRAELADHVLDRLDANDDGQIDIATESLFRASDWDGKVYDLRAPLERADESKDGAVTKQELIDGNHIGYYGPYDQNRVNGEMVDVNDGVPLSVSLWGYATEATPDEMNRFMRSQAKPTG
ncbi:MAG: hypothetical protein ABI200_03405 [Gaiellales bacterium]